MKTYDIISGTGNLRDLLTWRAAHYPEKDVFRFVSNSCEVTDKINFKELDAYARGIARSIIGNAGRSKECVLLLYPAGIDFIKSFMGCVYANKIAVPFPIPHSKNVEGVLKVIKNARIKLVLTDAKTAATIGTKLAKLAELSIIVTDEIRQDTFNDLPKMESEDVIYLQYTSGSTSDPKGVMITHENLLSNLNMIYQCYEFAEGNTIATWLPHFHDMGLVSGIMLPIYAIELCYLLSPFSFIFDPFVWLNLITKYKVTLSGAPNFAYDLCVKKINDDKLKLLDLSLWKRAYSGAEPIRHGTLMDFYRKFKKCGFSLDSFFPSYGLAESTLFVASGYKDYKKRIISVDKQKMNSSIVEENVLGLQENRQSQILVGCGQNTTFASIKIVDPEKHKECGKNCIGEIWVSSPSNGAGYWNNEAETNRIFNNHVTGDNDKYMRTGDLGFILRNELYVIGRIKDIIIVRGRNYYPNDIECLVEKCHPFIKDKSAVAFPMESNGKEELGILFEVKNKYGAEYKNEIIEAVLSTVSEQFDINPATIGILKGGSILKTTSGKKKRILCKKKFMAGELNILDIWNHEESNSTGEIKVLGRSESQSFENIVSIIKAVLVRKARFNRNQIETDKPFNYYGLDSLVGIEMMSELNDLLGIKLAPEILFMHPTIDALSNHVDDLINQKGKKTNIASIPEKKPLTREPIAIVGIGCRFPDAENKDKFYANLLDGKHSIKNIFDERWKSPLFNRLYGNVEPEKGSDWAGLINDIESFDNHFFRISHKEAIYIDPQQRHLLEVVFEALEDAGMTFRALSRSLTGVFIAISNMDYASILYNRPEMLNAYWSTGSSMSIAANRISYFLNLKGPSISIDTACSSSLTAVHLACNSLWAHESDNTIVGGVNLIINPAISSSFADAGALSVTGRCSAFDNGANGLVRGEGAGAIILKRMSDAVNNHDNIYAVISGTAVNQDGLSNGLSAPNMESQINVISAALDNAGKLPRDIGYFETHGTGTRLGDPIEAKALNEIFGKNEKRLLIGSVKTNVGHLESAAGICSLIKMALSMKKGMIPASINFRRLNELIPAEANIEVNIDTRRWNEIMPHATAGISAFGFGGTNACIILQESANGNHACEVNKMPRHSLLPLSIDNEEKFGDYLENVMHFIRSIDENDLYDILYSYSVKRNHYRNRMTVVFSDKNDLIHKLDQYIEQGYSQDVFTDTGKLPGERKLVFIFSGYGSQWVGMGKILLDNDVFMHTIEDIDNELSGYAGFRVRDFLLKSDDSLKDENNLVMNQISIFAIQMGVLNCLRHLGINPNAVVGYSLGEVTAAYAAGYLAMEDAIKIMYWRSLYLNESLKESKDCGMLIVRKPPDHLAALIDDNGLEISISSHNGPKTCTVSGDNGELRKLEEILKSDKAVFRRILAPGAGHSVFVEKAKIKLNEKIKGMTILNGEKLFYSTVKGCAVHASDLNDGYWGDNLRNPILFYEAISSAIKDGHNVFVEISPNPVLNSSVMDILKSEKAQGIYLPTLVKNDSDDKSLLCTSGKLYSAGFNIDWSHLYRSARFLRFPSYMWNHKRIWIDIDALSESTGQAGCRDAAHPFLYDKVEIASDKNLSVWNISLSDRRFHYLMDHRIHGETLLPGTAFTEIILAAALEIIGSDDFVLSDIRFLQTLFYTDTVKPALQVVLTRQSESDYRVKIFSRKVKSGSSDDWRLNAEGMIRRITRNRRKSTESISQEIINNTQCGLVNHITGENHYRNMKLSGIQYDGMFRSVEGIWYGGETALGKIESQSNFNPGYRLHPGLLDSCLQAFSTSVFDTGKYKAGEYLPVSIDEVKYYGRLGRKSWCLADYNPGTKETDVFTGNFRIYDGESFNLVAEITGFKVKKIRSQMNLHQHITNFTWQKSDSNTTIHSDLVHAIWIIFADDSGYADSFRKILNDNNIDYCLVYDRNKFDLSSWNNISVTGNFENYIDLFEHIGRDAQSRNIVILHMWSMNVKASRFRSDEFDVNGILRHIQSVKNIVKAINKRKDDNGNYKLWICTDRAQPVDNDCSRMEIFQAPIWGLGKTVFLENNALWGGLIDIDGYEHIHCIYDEIVSGSNENLIAFRQGQRYVQRLIKEFITNSNPYLCKPDVTYLITGGLGELGLKLAEWLVEIGARHLLLIGRSVLPEREQWYSYLQDAKYGGIISKLLAIEKKGCSIGIISMDISDHNALGEAIDLHQRREKPPIKGIFHLAGNVMPDLVSDMEMDDVKTMLKSKISGSWNLFKLFEKNGLDFMVLFSSGSSVIGSLFLGAYSAANSFLDALSHYGALNGMNIKSVNWGFWKETGMASRITRDLKLSHAGIIGFDNLQAFDVLSRIPGGTKAQYIVMPFDWDGWVTQNGHLSGRFPLIENLLARQGTETAFHEQRKNHDIRVDISNIISSDTVKRPPMIREYIKEVIKAVSEDSALKINDRSTINELGIDSLMAIAIKNRVESDLDIQLSPVVLLKGPTISELSIDINDSLSKKDNDVINIGAFMKDDTQGYLSNIDRMSEKEIDELLNKYSN
ncbi:MAG: AMP-binding protein [Spirochaetales bacterium]|nr:AMP-binding protein [Spirochaetales bacterium]